MAQYTKVPGRGTLLSLWIASAYVLVGQRLELDGPDMSTEMIDDTDLDGTQVSYFAGIPDVGKFSIKLFFNPNNTTHQAIQTLALTVQTAPSQWKLAWNDGSTTTPANFVFYAYLSKFKPTGMKQGEMLQAEIELQVTSNSSQAFTAGV